jgi:hypothetical protein
MPGEALTKAREGVPPEVEAVLPASTNLKPCERKYRRLPYDKFLEHVRNDRCSQRHALLLQLDGELKMTEWLRRHKN